MAHEHAKTQYYTSSSLDGFVATPDHDLGWLLQFGDPGSGYDAFYQQVGAVAMGSSTYTWLLRHHVRPEGHAPQPWPYAVPAWVFTSRDLPTVDGADVRFVRGDVRPVHAAMAAAAAGKNVWIVGGGDLAGQFLDAGLLDELIVQVVSVTLGAGAPLLPRRVTTPPLRLVSATPYGAAWVELRYEVPKAAT
jgi:dihydrofolate reductase